MIVERGFGQCNGRTAEPAFRADPADKPLRAPASGAVILSVRPVDDVVPALCEARRNRSSCPLVDKNIRHSQRSTALLGFLTIVDARV